MTDPGAEFVAALAAKDTDRLLAVLSPSVEFRGMTPGRFWEASTAGATVHEVLYRWFEPTDVVEEVVSVETADVADRHRVDYRLVVRNEDGRHLVEQRAYYDLDDGGRIARVHAVCAGFRPLP
ncbi:hypothetical protein SAMN05660199_02084 [Klenkia soli]|uniref:SnoaL-like domain-containing protein n=1 Tax=Klenkia soli TaxID=1052260 RepID=A0A1H0KAP6_9ACTN|nr:hypothetical protein [Klenkia soli]SDO52956.1 hypothetical protein SAMN05660199_02084 [Klenkia soli]